MRNYLFAPSESRAQDFLRTNRFGLDDRTVVRIDHHATEGMRFFDTDTIYLLDGVSDRALGILQRNVTLGPGTPRIISVEER